MAKRQLWLDKTLVIGPHLALCLDEKEFKRAIKGLNYDYREEWLSEGSDGTTHTFESHGGIACIISIGNLEGKTQCDIHALLVHEAVHVWQRFVEFIGEEHPSDEFEAYSIQAITQTLLEAYENAVTALPSRKDEVSNPLLTDVAQGRFLKRRR